MDEDLWFFPIFEYFSTLSTCLLDYDYTASLYVHKLRHHLFSFRMCEATLCINVRISRLTKKYKERRKRKAVVPGRDPMVGSTPQPPLWLIRNPSSGLWGKSNVRIQFIFSEKTSDEDLFGRRRRRLDQKKFQFLKHDIQGGMLIQGTCAAVTRESVICPLSNF